MKTNVLVLALAWLSVGLASAQNCTPPPSGLVSWWPGEGNASDIIGGNNGTLMNGTGFTNGEVGTAFNLNGVSNFVLIPASTNLTTGLQNGFTFEGWIKPATVTSVVELFEYERALATYNGSDVGILFAIHNTLPDGTPGSCLVANLLDTNGVAHILASPTNLLTAEVWQHVALSYDKASGQAVIYINGAAVTVTNLGSFTPQTGFTNLLLGARTTFGSVANPPNAYAGGMDEVSFYSRALAASDIATIYNSGRAGKCPPEATACTPLPAGLVSWWPGEGTASDLVGSNNGTLMNGTGFTNGEVGTAFNLNGANNFVLVNAGPNLTSGLQNGFTFEGWIKPMTVTSVVELFEYERALATYNGSDVGILFAIHNTLPDGTPGSCLFANLLDTNGGVHIIASPTNLLTSGVWQHVALSYDRTSGLAAIYFNGVAVTQTNLGSFTPQTAFTNLLLGARTTFGSVANPPNAYAGGMDEISFYNRALSTNEIAAIYHAGSAGKCPILPEAHAATGTAALTNGFVIAVNLMDDGYGYTNVPPVRLVGGGGSGAQAVAVVSNGMVTAVVVVDAGHGYTSAPLVVIDPPFIPQPVLGITPLTSLVFSNLAVGGVYQLQQSQAWYWTNVSASFTATNAVYTQFIADKADGSGYRLAASPVPTQAFATPKMFNGFVVGATLTSGGSGYVTSPAVGIVGGGGANATAVAQISGGMVTNINITDAGGGYTGAPSIEIAPPPAAAVVPAQSPVMRVDAAGLAPYDNYQLQFTPAPGAPWGNWNGGLFTPTAATNSQYIFITNGTGFFRLQYAP